MQLVFILLSFLLNFRLFNLLLVSSFLLLWCFILIRLLSNLLLIIFVWSLNPFQLLSISSLLVLLFVPIFSWFHFQLCLSILLWFFRRFSRFLSIIFCYPHCILYNPLWFLSLILHLTIRVRSYLLSLTITAFLDIHSRIIIVIVCF